MRSDRKAKRQAQIEQAAYSLLEKHGFAGTTMQGIAEAAQASNQTLYSWYGDKWGLYRALTLRLASDVRELLEESIGEGKDPMETLSNLAPILIDVMTHSRTISMHRAAAADTSGELAALIYKTGRGDIGKLVLKVMEDARDNGSLIFDDGAAAMRLFLDLLVGDLQHLQVAGHRERPDEAYREARAKRAFAQFRRLLDGSEPRM